MSKFSFIKYSIGALMLSMLLFSCKKGKEEGNLPPDTQLSIKSIDLVGENRLNSSVRLSWFGTDPDGYVIGYEYSLDNDNWTFIESQDTIFKFDIGVGNDSLDVSFFVRAIDDDLAIDETPAFLTIPLKNSPPSIQFEEKSFYLDTIFGVATFRWFADDPDGRNTLSEIQIKINEGEWTSIPQDQQLISLVGENPRTNGNQNAMLYGNLEEESNLSVPGLIVGDTNRVYLRSVDIAQRKSEVDTSHTFYMLPLEGDLLLVSGQPANVNVLYTDLMDKVYPNYDLLDLYDQNFKYLPYFWQPTASILFKQYDKVVMHTNETEVRHPVSSNEEILIEAAISTVQDYSKNGGKIMISHTFPSKPDVTNIRGVVPVDTLSQTRGQAVLPTDSLIEPVRSGYPELFSRNYMLGADPFFPTADAEIAYVGHFQKVGGWNGPSVAAAIRKNESGQVNQWFWSIAFHELSGNAANQEATLNKILNEDFSW